MEGYLKKSYCEILKESMRNLQMGQRGTRIQAPECPVNQNLKDLPIFHFWVQVCFEEMAPPRQIFHCVNGHFVCGGCKPNIQVLYPLQTPTSIVIFDH